jgi:hypothetical protein
MLERILKELPGRACEHIDVITTHNHGLERQVCESCGHVTVLLLDTSADNGQLVGTVHQHRARPNLADALMAEDRG